MGRKLTVHKKKGPKPKLGPELRDNDMPVKMRVGKGLSEKKARKLSKNEKENMNTTKSKKVTNCFISLIVYIICHCVILVSDMSVILAVTFVWISCA